MLSITSTDFAITNEPKGLRELKHRIYYAPELRSYLEEFDGDLTFYGSDYHYLRNTYIQGACSIVPVIINDGCGLILNGNLFLNDAEWRPDICEVRLQVVDGGFLSLIDNNMGIKAYLNVPRSKNDVDITDWVSVQSDLNFKSNSVSGGDSTGRSGIRVYDAYKMLVGFMTDGLLGFESDYLFPDDTNAEVRIPTLVTAEQVRNGSSPPTFPYISFEDLHGDMARLYNLSFEVQDGVLRVEPDSYFRQTSEVMTISNPNTIEQTSDTKSFYQKVKFGSQSEDSDDFSYYPNITFLGFRREEYHLGGQCNTKSVLNLEMTELITDTNVIMAALPNVNGGTVDFESKEEDIFIVSFDINNESVVYAHPLDSAYQYYNKLLSNFEVSLRWGDGVPFPIFQYLGENQNGAKGVLQYEYFPTINTINILNLFALVKFPNRIFPIGFDPNANMSDVSYNLDSVADPFGNTGTDANLKTIFTSPVSSVYTAIAKIRYTEPITQPFERIAIFRYGSAPSTNVIDAVSIGGSNIINGALELELSWTTYLDTGDRLAVAIINIENVIQDSYFQVNDLEFIEKTYLPSENYLINTSFDYPLTSQDWQNFMDDRYGKITINHKEGQVIGFLKDVTRKLETGMTEWEIKSTFVNS